MQLSYTGIASSDDRRSGYRGPRGASDFNTRKGGKGGRGKGGYGNNGDGDDDNNGGRYGNGNGEDDNNGGRYGNGNGGDDDDLDGFRKRSKLGGVGVSDSKYHLKKGMSQGSLQDEPEFIIEDLEKGKFSLLACSSYIGIRMVLRVEQGHRIFWVRCKRAESGWWWEGFTVFPTIYCP